MAAKSGVAGTIRYRASSGRARGPQEIAPRRHGAEPNRSIRKSRSTLTFGVRCRPGGRIAQNGKPSGSCKSSSSGSISPARSEEHTSELQSLRHLVCRLLLEKKKHNTYKTLSQKDNQRYKIDGSKQHQHQSDSTQR